MSAPALRRIREDARIAREANATAEEFGGIVRACADRFARESRKLSAVGALYLYYSPSTAEKSGQLRIGQAAEAGEELAAPDRLPLWITYPGVAPWVAERARRLPLLRTTPPAGGAA